MNIHYYKCTEKEWHDIYQKQKSVILSDYDIPRFDTLIFLNPNQKSFMNKLFKTVVFTEELEDKYLICFK